MSVAYQTPVMNPHIAALEPAIGQATDPVELLAIAHNEPRLLRAVCRALSEESAAVLEISQDRWDFDDPQQQQAIEWALQQGQVKQLLLVGSSQSGGAQSKASVISQQNSGQEKRGFDSILENVERGNSQVAAAQQRFAELLHGLAENPVVQDQMRTGALTLVGLFYHSASGTFAAYDLESKKFRALMHN